LPPPHSFPTRRSSDLSCEKFLTHMRTWLPKLGFTAPAGSTIISRPAETEKMLAEWPRAHTPEPSSTHRSSDFLPVVPAFAFENRDRKSTRLNSSHVAI